MDNKDILSLTYDELNKELLSEGLKAFRVKQIFSWLHSKRVNSFDEMTDLPATLRTDLANKYSFPNVTVERRLVSKIDGTVKYLFALKDGEHVEGVLMDYKRGGALCISTQAGCKMGCTFCASTPAGFSRNLTAGEMLEEVYLAQKDAAQSGGHVASIVLMGIGEPLDNFANVLDFLNIVTDERGFNMGMRRISLSTCGLVDKIYELAQRKLQLTLSVSLHAPNDEIRSHTMPVAKRWSMDKLLKACKDYFSITGRRISFEYALIDGVNDSDANALELSNLLKGMGAHVNLIPVNEVKESGYRRGKRESVARFQQMLINNGINATVRRELGADINAACGQLRRTAQSIKDEL